MGNLFASDETKSRRLNGTGPLIEFVRHEKYPGWTLVLDGNYHSNLDIDEEPKLNFDYDKRIVALANKFLGETTPISVLHLGGGAMAIARYLEETRPGSKQVLVEIEEDVTRFVQEHFPLAVGTNIEIIHADAANPRKALSSSSIQKFDLIICDAYLRYLAEPEDVGLRFYKELEDLLADSGVLIINAVETLDLQVQLALEQFSIVKTIFDGASLVLDIEDVRNARKTNLLIVAGYSEEVTTYDELKSDHFGATAVVRDEANPYWPQV